MKKVLLSADGKTSVFGVPDEVADNLAKYCTEFCCHWLIESPDAAQFRVKVGNTTVLRYSEKDFIDYLNKHIRGEKSILIETLADASGRKKLPAEYKKLPYFNF